MDTAQHTRRAARVPEVQKPLLEQAASRQAEAFQEVKFALVPQIPACNNVKAKWCRRRDSNPHGLSTTVVQARSVYQFRPLRRMYNNGERGPCNLHSPMLLLLSLFSFRLNLSR
jgi:hypothetical protein